MLIFHEGLPRSGKSYEAVVKHVLPALKAGRCVYARIDGLDRPECRQKIADLIEVRVNDLDDLLFHVSSEDVPNLYKIATKKSFVVIDEIARYWAAKGRRSLVSDEMSDFLKEHGHFDIDILAMDQDLRDVAPLWRRRVDRKVVFTKLDMLGAKNNYKWKMFKALEGEKFELVGKGAGKYDPKYFGTYASHVSDDLDGKVYEDDRAVIWKRPAFKYGMPLAFIMIGLCAWFIVRLFDPNHSALVPNKNKPVPAASPLAQPVPSTAPVVPAVYVPPAPAQQPKKTAPVDYVKSFVEAGNRLRLVSVLSSPGRDPYIVIEFRDDALRVTERLDNYMLQSLGWYIQVISLKLVKVKKPGETDMIATSWPIEYDGRLSMAQNDDVRRQGGGYRRMDRDDSKAGQDGTDQNEVAEPPKTYQVSSGLHKNFNAQQYVTLDKLQWVKGVVR